MASRTLKVEIIGDTSSLSRAFKGVGGDVSTLEGHVKRAGRSFATFGKLAGGAGLAIGAGLALETKRAVVAFEETRKVAAQTNAVLKSTGGAAKISAAGVADLATAISKKTGIDDEAVQSTENMLLTFTKLRNETGKGNDIFTQATKIATDMSVALGQDGTKSAIQLGKALNDPVKGVTALSRVGVTFTEDQKKQIKTLEDTGHHMEAQKLILRELNTEFKGSAAAQATPLEKAKVAVGNLEEALGKGLAPVVDLALTKFTNLARKVEPQLNVLTKQISGTFKRKDLDLGEKVSISWAKIQAKLKPFGQEFVKALDKANLGTKLSAAVEKAAPMLADAFAAAAPRAAGAFVRAFKEAGPWGKLVTVAFLASKLGAFSSVGSWAAGKFTASLKRKMGSTLPAAGAEGGAAYSGAFATTSAGTTATAMGKGGKLRGSLVRASRGMGSAMGIGAAAFFAVELARGAEKALGNIAPGGLGGHRSGGSGNQAHLPGGGSGWNLWDWAKDKIGDGVGKIVKRHTNDAGGPGMGLPAGGAFGGSLHGARAAMRPFAVLGSRYGLQVTSGKDDHSTHTSSGNVSWHSSGEAIDMGGSLSGMHAYANTLRSKYGGRLAELISPWPGLGIKNGRPYRYSSAIQAQHSGGNAHVHVAFDSGRPGVGDGDGVVSAFRRAISSTHAPAKAQLALWEAGIVESGLRNLDYGDADSQGALQVRVGLHGAKLAMDPLASALAFLRRGFTGKGGAISLAKRNPKMSAGQIAQAVQGSRFPGRYDGVESQARRYLSGGTGGGSAGPGSAYRGAQGAFRRSQSAAGRAVARALHVERDFSGPGAAGSSEQQTASLDLEKATATAHDNLGELIKALQHEKRIKTRRLKHINRYLKRRIKKTNRIAWTNEKAQLIADLAEINALLKEYKADAAAGATTISAAEGLTAGVAPDGSHLNAGGTAIEENAAEGPTPTDFANAAIAEASLTPGLDDDIARTRDLLGIVTGDLAAARASNDPRKISEAIAAWSAVNSSLQDLLGVVNNEAETRQRLIDSNVALAAEMKTSNEFARSVAGIATREAVRALADVISGQIVGTNLQGRRLTAGNGVVAITP